MDLPFFSMMTCFSIFIWIKPQWSPRKLYLIVTYMELNHKLLNKRLFSNVKALSISGFLSDIHADLFETFPNLKVISFQIYNLEMFIKNGLKWIQYLNTGNSWYFFVFILLRILCWFRICHFFQVYFNILRDIVRESLAKIPKMPFFGKDSPWLRSFLVPIDWFW